MADFTRMSASDVAGELNRIGCPYFTLLAAMENARAGDTVELWGRDSGVKFYYKWGNYYLLRLATDPSLP
jgi:hypothetical protein